MKFLARMFLSLAIVVTVEWRSDDDAVTMSTLLLVSFALGWSWSRLSLLSGVILGTTIAALNLPTLTTGLRPAYETA